MVTGGGVHYSKGKNWWWEKIQKGKKETNVEKKRKSPILLERTSIFLKGDMTLYNPVFYLEWKWCNPSPHFRTIDHEPYWERDFFLHAWKSMQKSFSPILVQNIRVADPGVFLCMMWIRIQKVKKRGLVTIGLDRFHNLKKISNLHKIEEEKNICRTFSFSLYHALCMYRIRISIFFKSKHFKAKKNQIHKAKKCRSESHCKIFAARRNEEWKERKKLLH